MKIPFLGDNDKPIRFLLDKNEIKRWPEEEYEALEMALDGDVKLYRLRPVFARYMVDENNKPIPKPIAMLRLGQIAVEDWDKIVQKFAEGMQETAIPNANGSLSKSPSEVSSAAPSLDGSTS